MNICDGCNVRGLWEHRCHGERAVVGGVQTNKPCECSECRELDKLFSGFTKSIEKERGDWMEKIPEQLFFDFSELCTCLKDGEWDCLNPPPDDWSGKDGVWLVSESCPVHNLYPAPDPNCPWHG